MPEDDIEFGSLTVISIDYLLVYENKYYLRVYLDICDHKIANKQMNICDHEIANKQMNICDHKIANK